MKKFVKDLIPYVVIVVVVILIRSFIVTPVRVTGASMAPTLKDGEIMLLYKLSKIERNDIIVIDTDSSDGYIIKRVIALPGESIEYKDGNLFINDKKTKDKYGSGETEDIEKIKLKKDEYFVMGDNREWSKDSRIIGPVKEKDIQGETKITIFPVNKIGIAK
jgi:signal peptidase I